MDALLPGRGFLSCPGTKIAPSPVPPVPSPVPSPPQRKLSAPQSVPGSRGSALTPHSPGKCLAPSRIWLGSLPAPRASVVAMPSTRCPCQAELHKPLCQPPKHQKQLNAQGQAHGGFGVWSLPPAPKNHQGIPECRGWEGTSKFISFEHIPLMPGCSTPIHPGHSQG